MPESRPGGRPDHAAPTHRHSPAAVALALAFGLLAGGARAQTPEWVEGIRVGLPTYVPGTFPDRPRIMYRDSLLSMNDICPVRKARLDPDRKPVYVNGQPIGFCCTPCPVTFSADPEKYLSEMHATFHCPVHPSRLAILDSSLRGRVNQDIFFFSTVAAKNLFLKNPLRYVKTLTDPVSFERFHPTKASPHVSYRGRDYYFAADSTLARFQAEPDQWFERKTSN